MGTRVRLLVLVLLAALALPPAPTATARTGAARADDPPTRVLAPLSLGRGPDAAVDFLQDGIIHAAGRAIAVRAPANREQRQLLGRAPGHGWLVAVRKGYVGRVLSVRPGRAPKEVRRTRFTTYGQGDSSVGWLLSDDGAMLVSTLFDRGGTTYRAQDLDGHGLGGGYATAYFNPWDADGGHVVTYAENTFYRLRVVDWSPRTSRTEIAKAVSYVSLRDDLMFARTTGRLYGPTPVSAPATPPWAEPFAPLAVTPDGATAIGLRLAGSGFDSPAILDVRRMSDGRLLDSIAFGPRITEDTWSITSQHEQTAAWESDTSFVLQLPTSRGAVLVRCDLRRSCERASDTGGNISFAHETYMWW